MSPRAARTADRQPARRERPDGQPEQHQAGLQRAVAQDVLQPDRQRQDDPEQALREYIAGKLRFSREHPDDSRVYANEVVSGAPIFSAEIAERVIPALQADVAIFNRWAEQGLCRPVDGRHLMILLWASTQVYADWASQISLVLGKKKLGSEDFAAAETLIVDMVLRTVLVKAN